MTKKQIEKRLREIKREIKKESISWGEIAELQVLAPFIDKSDVELLQWAGIE